MVRAIIAAVCGYVMLAALVVAGIAVLWFTMGNQFAFDGESNRASTLWCLVMLAWSVVAAVVAGALVGRLGGPRADLAVRVLLVIVLVLGVLNIVTQLAADPVSLPAGKSVTELTFAEAGQCAISPLWYNMSVVITGMLGVGLGSRLVRTTTATS